MLWKTCLKTTSISWWFVYELDQRQLVLPVCHDKLPNSYLEVLKRSLEYRSYRPTLLNVPMKKVQYVHDTGTESKNHVAQLGNFPRYKCTQEDDPEDYFLRLSSGLCRFTFVFIPRNTIFVSILTSHAKVAGGHDSRRNKHNTPTIINH